MGRKGTALSDGFNGRGRVPGVPDIGCAVSRSGLCSLLCQGGWTRSGQIDGVFLIFGSWATSAYVTDLCSFTILREILLPSPPSVQLCAAALCLLGHSKGGIEARNWSVALCKLQGKQELSNPGKAISPSQVFLERLSKVRFC